MKPLSLTRVRVWAVNCLIAFDQLCNVIFLAGEPGETISAHAGRAMQEGRRWGKALAWFLNAIQAKHSQGAIDGDLNRAEKIERIEDKARATESPSNRIDKSPAELLPRVRSTPPQGGSGVRLPPHSNPPPIPAVPRRGSKPSNE